MSHPYRSLPPTAFWRASIGQRDPFDVDPVVKPRFVLTPETRVATAGSCFAQHVARHLKAAGMCYMEFETPHPLMDRAIVEEFGYGLFPARYGNIYTARQLVQTFKRAHGTFLPQEDIWPSEDGRFFRDPFRPQIQPDGFASLTEYRLDRERHFTALRRMFAKIDLFIFTLGLTEAWEDSRDGAVFPLCPGVAGGTFDPDRHRAVNYSASQVIDDLNEFLALLATVNPAARVILTVSPVPLMATSSGGHVLPATVYSKSVLRVAADEIRRAHAHVDYFPSYEFIAGPQGDARFFEADKRSIRPEAVARVMGLFFHHYYGKAVPHDVTGILAENASSEQERTLSEQIARLLCDEEALDCS